MTDRQRMRGMRKLAIYLAGLFLTFHYVLIIYVNSSLLKESFDPKIIGVFYIIGSILSIALFIKIPQLLRKIGNLWTAFIFIILELAATLGLAVFSQPITLVLFFLLHHSLMPLIFFALDIFLEHEQGRESGTGTNRGTYLTFQNIAWITAPIIAGLLAKNFGLQKVYLISSIFILPLAISLILAFKGYRHKYTSRISLKDTWVYLRTKMDVKRAIASNTLLQFFYALMVIYIPILLVEKIGFSWQEIGVILSVMLLPFLLLEFPLGLLADKKTGEVEIMRLGFLVAAVATFVIPFMNKPHLVWWALLLFATRVGASSVEISSESYFFKHVKGHDTGVISIFRMNRPLSYIIASVFALIVLSFTSYQGLFAVLAILMLSGLLLTPKRDTR